MKTKRLYRVTATYPGGRVWHRDYQAPGSARERRDRLMDRVEETEVIVTITVSDPITWPTS